MKNLRKILLVLLTVFLISSIVVGCSAKKSEIVTEDTAVENQNAADMSKSEEAGFGSAPQSSLEPEKVITTIDLRFETTEFDKSVEELEKIISKYDGYVESSDINTSSRNYRNGNYVIRVPKTNIQKFKSDLNSIGNKTMESINKQDVTKQYTDTQSRIKVLEVKEERILSLMEKAEKIEDIIKLEDELSKVIYEKEQLKSNLMNLDDKIEYSTIYLYIIEVDKFTSSNTPDTTFGDKVSNALGDSIYFFKNTLEKLVILMIYLLPFIILFGIIGYVVYKALIRYKKNKMN